MGAYLNKLDASGHDVDKKLIWSVKRRLRKHKIPMRSCASMRKMVGNKKQRVGLFGELMQLAYKNRIAVRTPKGIAWQR